MLELKSCPKCKGDVVIDRDRWGWYEQCIQCGRLRDLESIAEVIQRCAQERRKNKLSRLRN